MYRKYEFNLTEEVFAANLDDDKVAYYYLDQPFTYGELIQLVQDFNSCLLSLGVEPGDRLILSMNDSPTLVAIFLAACARGAIPICVNPKLREKNFNHILHDSGAVLVVCEPEYQAIVSATLRNAGLSAKVHLLINDSYDKLFKVEASALLLSGYLGVGEDIRFNRAPPDSPAFWQYTSGTTGVPKATKHHGLAMVESNRLFAVGTLGIGSSNIIYSVPKMSFGYGLGNSLFFTLLNHATALLDPYWPSPERVVANIQRIRPNVLFGVPAIFSSLIEHGEEIVGAMGQEAIFCSAGSPLPGSVFNKWKHRYQAVICDGIGATEVGHIFLNNRRGDAKAGVTGKPVEGYAVKVVKQDGQEAGLDEQGVLYVRGPSLALGYFNDSVRTRERFVDGWYRTGDLFTKDKEGYYRFQGREDDVFKVNGQWVAPLEIESFLLCNCAFLKEAVLVPILDSKEMTVPFLFLVKRENTLSESEASGQIMAYLKEAFEPYKLPVRIVFQIEIPKNENGKVVRSALGRDISCKSKGNSLSKATSQPKEREMSIS
ncbi:MAG: CoA ligase [unclassified Hahellaceae]|nr:CoA ligase [Hahellaceae bacterium]|tara:strand:+ start:13950 stop:15578 length:1629 start_codon:yes stop_codon:yes gene_type:complete